MHCFHKMVQRISRDVFEARCMQWGGGGNLNAHETIFSL
jgi:hypothetical protein